MCLSGELFTATSYEDAETRHGRRTMRLSASSSTDLLNAECRRDVAVARAKKDVLRQEVLQNAES
jgi:hypothetical protein